MMDTFQTILTNVLTLLGGTSLGYFILPKKTKRNLEQKFTEELAARVTHLEQMLDKSTTQLLTQAEKLGELRAEVAQCKEMHRKVLNNNS